MGRPVGRPARYCATPLYKLRKAVGGDGPVTNDELARLIDTPLPTVKFFGRRQMSENFLDKIRMALGAVWDKEGKRWLFAFSRPGEKVPYTHEIFLLWCEPSSDRKAIAAEVANKVKVLLELVSESRVKSLWFRVERAIAKWQQEFDVSGTVLLGKQAPADGGMELKMGLKEYLEQLRPAFVVEFNKETKKLRFIRISPTFSEVYKSVPELIFEPGAISKK